MVNDLRRWMRLVESPHNDIERARNASQATSMVSHAIYGGVKADAHVDIEGFGEYLVYGADALGLTKPFPELDKLCLMFGHKKENAVGLSGGVWSFKTPLLDHFLQCLVVHGLQDMTDDDVKKLVTSTGFLNIGHHEFIHVFDSIRSPLMMNNRAFDGTDRQSYYNDPAEFNAYYHDAVDGLTHAMAEGAENAQDYVDLYGLTGDFKVDLPMLLGKDIHTRSFVKWLTEPRRKALLRRIYKLHQHIFSMIRDAKPHLTSPR